MNTNTLLPGKIWMGLEAFKTESIVVTRQNPHNTEYTNHTG